MSAGARLGAGVRDHYLLHYVVSGRGTYETESRTFVLSAGDAFLARPETPILYQADREDPWEYYWVGFAGPSAALLLAQTPFTRTHPVLHPAAGERLRQALLDIYKARGADYPSAVRMAGYLQAALGLLMETAPPRGGEALTVYARQGAAFLAAELLPLHRRGGGGPAGRGQPELPVPGVSGGVRLLSQRLPHPLPHPAGHPAAAPQHAAHQRRGGLRGI